MGFFQNADSHPERSESGFNVFHALRTVWNPRCDQQLTDPGDEVVLQVEDLQVPAPAVDVLDLLDVLLVKRDFLQGQDLAIVVLGPPPDHFLCDCVETTTLIMAALSLGDCFMYHGRGKALDSTDPGQSPDHTPAQEQ